MRNKDKRGGIIQRLLKREILRHLKEQGVIHYSLVYAGFDHNRKTDIEEVLQESIQSNLIKVDQDTVIRITDTGLQFLAETQE